MNAQSPNRFGLIAEDLRVAAALHSPEGMGQVVVLLSEEETRKDGWSDRAALAVARHWASEGFRVVLADGDFVTPSLHELLGVPNEEGLSDLILYGASANRVSFPTDFEDFTFNPAGTIVSNVVDAYRHTRWPEYFATHKDAGHVLVLYLPDELEGVEALADSADRVFRFTRSDVREEEDPRVVVLHEGAPNEGGANEGGAISHGDASTSEFDPDVSPEVDRVALAEPSVGKTRTGRSALGDPPAETSDTAAAPSPEADREPLRSGGSKSQPPGRRLFLWIGLTLIGLILALIVGVLLGVFTLPGLSMASEPAELAVHFCASCSPPERG